MSAATGGCAGEKRDRFSYPFSETVGANKGLGKLMLDAQASFQVPIVFAGLLVLAVLGIVLYAATALIEARFTGWAFRGQADR